MLFGIRNRRGGGYIRFGRSAPVTALQGPQIESLLASFGEPDKRDGQYMRFGRDTSAVQGAATVEAVSPEEAHAEVIKIIHF